MYRIVPDIDKKFILSRLSQEEIFERYLGFPVEYCGKVCSPFREDRDPTCTFRMNPNGSITFMDWSGDFLGNCFDAVMRLHGCNFYDACKIIARDFGLVDGISIGTNFKRKPREYEKPKTESKDIKVKWRKIDPNDVDYWRSYGVEPDVLRLYLVLPVRFAWVNKELVYTYKENDPCYAYHFDDKVKLYFPKRENWRFLGNFVGLQGYGQLPETGDLLVITKSLKDVMFLHRCGIAAVAPPSESTILTEEQYQELSGRFKTLVSLYDEDSTGIRSANQMLELYGMPILYTTEYGGKDITDIVKAKSPEAAYKIITELTWQYKK